MSDNVLVQNNIESIYSLFQKSLVENNVLFSMESGVRTKTISMDIDKLKLYYPQTSDFIMFKHSGKIFFRFFHDEKTFEQEEKYIKAFWGESYEPNRADFDKYVFIRSFAALDVNILKAKEFKKYIEQWSSENNCRKIVFTKYFNIYSYVDIEKIIRDIPEQDSSSFQEKIYYKLFIQELVYLKNFIDYAVKNEFLIPEGSAIRYFDDYGLQSFIDGINPKHLIRIYQDENTIEIRTSYKKETESHMLFIYVTPDNITVKSSPKDEKSFSVCFPLEKNVTDKIRQFLSTAWEK